MINEIVFSTAQEYQIPLLKQLWMACFPEDRPDDIDRFYGELFSSMVCLIGTVDDRPVTMLHLLPAGAFVRGVSFPVRYLYAGCTHPAHRHHGYYVALLCYAKKHVEEIGECGIYLHPATAQLIPLYEKAGYTNAIVSAVPQMLDGNEIPLTLSAEDCAKRRQELILELDSNYVYFEPDAPVSAIFIEGMMREGVSLYSRNSHLMLVKSGKIIDSTPCDGMTYGSAMWLPTLEAPLLARAMSTYGGYTALLGE